MSVPRCWACNRRMTLKEGKRGYWLHCGPCAATFMDTDGKPLDAFLASYARYYAKVRGGG